ncbi:MAG: aspartate aminotransferase family protein [Phycisphaerales bacterium]
MSSDEFRRHGRAVIDWIADYLESCESRPVMPDIAPGEVAAKLPEAAPVTGEPFEAMLADMDSIVVPGLTHWQSPNWFAFFPANISGPSILGELLAAGLGVQGMLWKTGPAITEVETRVLDWLVPMLGLPEIFLSTSEGGGVIQDTASSATLCALLAARERATDWQVNARGPAATADSPLIAYTSEQAHSSIEKSMMIAGMGRENLRLLPTDAEFRLRPEALAEQIAADRAAGATPCFACVTLGTTSAGAIEPVAPIADICRREGLWLHVDGAMHGTAALCPEFREMHAGVEHADSYCFNPHKWMLTNFDCDCFYVRDRTELIRTLGILPEYLKNKATASGEVFDYRDWHVPLGRRFRALKLWFVIRHYGIEGLQAFVREHVRLAQHFAALVREHPRFELTHEPPLNLVCLRHVDGDAATQRILESINDSGVASLTQTKLGGRYVIRVSIGQSWTTQRHVDALWDELVARA